MNTRFLLAALLGLALSAGDALTQTLTTLYSFGDVSKQVGVHPAAPLLYAPDGLLYGSTSQGIGSDILRGAIFKVAVDGTGLQIVKQFTNVLDGAAPQGRLVLGGDRLYGLTTSGGTYGGGTIFRVRTNGTDFSVLHSFPSNAFSNFLPAVGGLTVDGSTLYGATPGGGTLNKGTLFRLNTDGSGYSVLKDFAGDDGAEPCGDLLLSGSTIYGVTGSGGSNTLGTIFRVETDGADFRILKTFESRFFPQQGGAPGGGLILADGVLYGSTLVGNSNPVQDPASVPRDDYIGTVFKLKTDGSEFQTLTTIGPAPDPSQSYGSGPVGPLVLQGDTLFGVTSGAKGLASGPSVFQVKTNGAGLGAVGLTMAGYIRAGISLANGTPVGAVYNSDYLFPAVPKDAQGHLFGGAAGIIHTFTGYAGDGGLNSVVMAGEYFYGTTAIGGSASAGTLFRVRTNGTDYSVLFSFPGGTNGFKPGSRLAIEGTNIFGITAGADYQGYTYQALLYRVGIDGRGYQVLRRFSGGPYFPAAGERPPLLPGPVIFGGRLYLKGYDADAGLVSLALDGSDYRVINPTTVGELTTADDAIYAISGGIRAARLIRITATNVTVLHEFQGAYQALPGRLAILGDTVFGLASFVDDGIHLFKCATNGSDFKLLDSLTVIAGDISQSSLVTDGRFLYGVAQPPPPPLVPTKNGGAIFRVSTNGSDAKIIYEFPLERGNVRPDGELIIENNALVGSTYSGGDAGQGTIFRLDLTPRLNVTASDSSVTLSWPEYANAYTLETTADLSRPDWRAVSLPEPATQITVTNHARAAFFRLRGP